MSLYENLMFLFVYEENCFILVVDGLIFIYLDLISNLIPMFNPPAAALFKEPLQCPGKPFISSDKHVFFLILRNRMLLN